MRLFPNRIFLMNGIIMGVKVSLFFVFFQTFRKFTSNKYVISRLILLLSILSGVHE